MSVIALDIMGGDKAPTEILKGAVAFASTHKDNNTIIYLIGDKPLIEEELKNIGYKDHRFFIEHAPTSISMMDHPVEALRKNPDSSIQKGINLIKNCKAEAFISAGNTGACVAAAMLTLELISGVRRPGIAVRVPSLNGYSILIDVGANIACKPLHLLHYGIMASIYYSLLFKKPSPTVGILNIGQEDSKGNPLTKETKELFKRSNLNFIGNIEGQDIFHGTCDVVVCEGFMGNAILKASEGCAETVFELICREFMNDMPDEFKNRFLELAQRVKRKSDYTSYGGAPLLGVNGLCIICHGRSNSGAIQNALEQTLNMVRSNLNGNIKNEIQKFNL